MKRMAVMLVRCLATPLRPPLAPLDGHPMLAGARPFSPSVPPCRPQCSSVQLSPMRARLTQIWRLFIALRCLARGPLGLECRLPLTARASHATLLNRSCCRHRSALSPPLGPP